MNQNINKHCVFCANLDDETSNCRVKKCNWVDYSKPRPSIDKPVKSCDTCTNEERVCDKIMSIDCHSENYKHYEPIKKKKEKGIVVYWCPVLKLASVDKCHTTVSYVKCHNFLSKKLCNKKFRLVEL